MVRYNKGRPSTGISHDKGNQRSPFRARYYNPENKKTEYIGRFKTREEAEMARTKYIKNKEGLNGGEEQLGRA